MGHQALRGTPALRWDRDSPVGWATVPIPLRAGRARWSTLLLDAKEGGDKPRRYVG